MNHLLGLHHGAVFVAFALDPTLAQLRTRQKYFDDERRATIGTNRMLTSALRAVAFITRLDAMKSGSVDT